MLILFFLCGGCNDDEELVCCFLFWVLLLFFRCPLVLTSDLGPSLSPLAIADFRLFHDWLVVDFLCFQFQLFQVESFSS